MVASCFPPAHRRSAVTLLELLLVLCLLVILAGLAWAALDRPLATQRLRKAADALRAEWGRARVEAISSGQTYIFRYTPESGQYSVECFLGPEAAPDAVLLDEPGVSGDGLQAPTASHWHERSLPEGIAFAAGQTAFDTRAQTALSEAESSMAGEPIPTEPVPVEPIQADPLLFYPDGTTSTAQVFLKNKHGRWIELSLRGLTGVVTVGETFSVEGPLP